MHPLNVGLWGWATQIAVKAKAGEWGYVFEEVPTGQAGMPAMSVKDIMARFDIPSFDILKVGRVPVRAAWFLQAGCSRQRLVRLAAERRQDSGRRPPAPSIGSIA